MVVCFPDYFYQSVFYSAVLIRGSSLGSTETFFPSVEVIMILFSSSYKPRAQAFSHRSDSWSVHPCQCQSIEPGEREPWLKMIFHLGLMIIDFLPCFVRYVQCNTPLIIHRWKPHNSNLLQWCSDGICLNAFTQSAHWTCLFLSIASFLFLLFWPIVP